MEGTILNVRCVNHSDVESAAFCVSCGRPLCGECTRTVRGTVYCELCLADSLRAAAPPPAQPTAGSQPAAAFALGLIPGVGAIYNGEFFKAGVHILIFGVLISLVDAANTLEALFVMLAIGFYAYMPFEAYYTAKKRVARERGVELETPVDRLEERLRSVENAELWGGVALVFVGAILLLDNFAFLDLGAIVRLWPIGLIALGVWQLRRWNTHAQGEPGRFHPGAPRPEEPPGDGDRREL